MSEENVELVRGFFDAYNARNGDLIDRLLSPDAEIRTLSERAGLSERWSPGASKRYFEQLGEAWSDLTVQVNDYREVDERVVACGVMRGAGSSSQIKVAREFAVVFAFTNSRIALVDTYESWTAGLAAVGLSE